MRKETTIIAKRRSDRTLVRVRPDGGLDVEPTRFALRRALGLSQEEFSARYHIPLETVRDWEQGRCEPDQPARAYLTVIARDPEGVLRALRAGPR